MTRRYRETDNAPVNVTNPIGLIILGNSTDRDISKTILVPRASPGDVFALVLTSALGVLASDFPLNQGTIEITVPRDLTPGYDYDIVREYPPFEPISPDLC